MFLTPFFPLGFLNELKHLSLLAVPMVITQLLQISFGPMAMIFVGHLGAVPLACASLATSLINVTGVAVVMGLSAACDTLFTQTYGSSNKKKLGVLLQRGILVLLVCIIPCFAIHINMERLLLLMGQDAVVAHLTGEYMLITIPGIAAFSVYMTVSKYVQCQGIALPSMIIAFFGNLICGVLHYVFIFKLHMGTNGSAWAITTGYCSLMILTLLYVLISKVYKDTWDGFDLDLFKEWGQFLTLAYSGMFMLCYEWWSFEAAIIFAGLLGTTHLGAQSIIYQTSSIAFMLPLGVGYAASIRVGQYLGQGSADGARTVTRVALVSILVVGLCVGIPVGCLRWHIPTIFSNDKEVIAFAADAIPVVAAFIVIDTTVGVGNGILRGMGKQWLGSLIVVVLYSIVLVSGIPVMLLASVGIKGYWLCLTGAIVVQSMALCGFLFTTNWENEVNQALARTALATSGEHDETEKLSSKHDPLISEEDKLKHCLEIGQNKCCLKLFNNKPNNETSGLLTQRKPVCNEMITLRCLTIGSYVMVLVIGVIMRVTMPPDPVDVMLPNNTTLVHTL